MCVKICGADDGSIGRGKGLDQVKESQAHDVRVWGYIREMSRKKRRKNVAAAATIL